MESYFCHSYVNIQNSFTSEYYIPEINPQIENN